MASAQGLPSAGIRTASRKAPLSTAPARMASQASMAEMVRGISAVEYRDRDDGLPMEMEPRQGRRNAVDPEFWQGKPDILGGRSFDVRCQPEMPSRRESAGCHLLANEWCCSRELLHSYGRHCDKCVKAVGRERKEFAVLYSRPTHLDNRSNVVVRQRAT